MSVRREGGRRDALARTKTSSRDKGMEKSNKCNNSKILYYDGALSWVTNFVTDLHLEIPFAVLSSSIGEHAQLHLTHDLR